MTDPKDKLIKELKEEKSFLEHELQILKKPKMHDLKEEQLQTDYVGMLRADLLNAAEKYRGLLAEKTALNQKMTNLKIQITRIENATAGKVSVATDGEGKKLHPNEASRKAALDKLLLEDNEYMSLKNELTEITHKNNANSDEIDILKLDIRNKRSILESLNV